VDPKRWIYSYLYMPGYCENLRSTDGIPYYQWVRMLYVVHDLCEVLQQTTLNAQTVTCDGALRWYVLAHPNLELLGLLDQHGDAC
jgi:hypothetical protein